MSKEHPPWRDKFWAQRSNRSAEQYVDREGWDPKPLRNLLATDPQVYYERIREGRYLYERNVEMDRRARLAHFLLRTDNHPAYPLQVELEQIMTNWHQQMQNIPEKPYTLAHDVGVLVSQPGARTYRKGLDALGVIAPRYIEINAESAEHFMNHREQYRAIICHELAHIIKGDVTMREKVAQQVHGANHVQEILTDRMGALLHGNPRQYAQGTEEYFISLGGFGEPASYQSTHIHPSRTKTLRMLNRWADILENEGAADKTTGQITNYAKALEIYERSKSFTEGLILYNSTPSRL